MLFKNKSYKENKIFKTKTKFYTIKSNDFYMNILENIAVLAVQ